MPPRIVVMLSGKGTNLNAILHSISKKKIWADVALVVSNRKEAYGLRIAEKNKIPTLYFPLKPYTDAGKSREEYDADLAEKIKAYNPNLIVLAGWMHVLSATFLKRFPNKVINLHPALPDKFPGKDAIHEAYDAFQRGEIRYSGCMVHYVVPEVDAGPVIQQIVVPIRIKEPYEAFERRMHINEHYLLPKAIRKVLMEQKRQYDKMKKEKQERAENERQKHEKTENESE
jgi:formyltetrahydrofolate-dependent phosphoribosylglycinamide formyltransferase